MEVGEKARDANLDCVVIFLQFVMRSMCCFLQILLCRGRHNSSSREEELGVMNIYM